MPGLRRMDAVRLTQDQVAAIKDIVAHEAGRDARARVFGSRAHDDQRGGDLDLLVEVPTPIENPALLSARIAGRASRLMHGRNVDVLLSAPNLERLPIHAMAARSGVPL